MTGAIRLLIADADASVRNIVKLSALEAGWVCDEASDGIAALKMLKHNSYHLLIIDTELPEVSGLVVSQYLHKSSKIPVIFISKNSREEDRLAGFNAGGNDYVLKPFYPRELFARAKNLLEIFGNSAGSSTTVSIGGITMETDSYGAFIENRKISLTPKEYELLLFLCQNPRQTFTREILLDRIWGKGFFGSDRTVDTHIKSLRIKMRPLQDKVRTVWGVGYVFEP